MKIDDYLTFEIVERVNEHPKPRITRETLLEKLWVDESDQEIMQQLYFHMRDIQGRKLLEFYDGTGFDYNDEDGAWLVDDHFEYEVTPAGRNFLSKAKKNGMTLPATKEEKEERKRNSEEVGNLLGELGITGKK